MRIGLLSVLNDPFLGYLIREFKDAELPIEAVFLDEKDLNAKNRKIFLERTNNEFPPLSLHMIDPSVPFYMVPNHVGRECIDLIRSLRIDLLINAGTPRILKHDLIGAAKVGVLNCHPGLLPNFRGCTCVEWAVFLDKQIGNTVHFIDEGIDTGPIVVSEGLHFTKNDSYTDVRNKVYHARHKLLVKGIKKVIEEGLHPSNMELQAQGEYFAPIDDEKLARVKEILSKSEYSYQY